MNGDILLSLLALLREMDFTRVEIGTGLFKSTILLALQRDTQMEKVVNKVTNWIVYWELPLCWESSYTTPFYGFLIIPSIN